MNTGLVIEDAPSGLKAGRAAGAKVMALCTSHSRDAIVASGADPDFIVEDLRRLVVTGSISAGHPAHYTGQVIDEMGGGTVGGNDRRFAVVEYLNASPS